MSTRILGISLHSKCIKLFNPIRKKQLCLSALCLQRLCNCWQQCSAPPPRNQYNACQRHKRSNVTVLGSTHSMSQKQLRVPAILKTCTSFSSVFAQISLGPQLSHGADFHAWTLNIDHGSLELTHEPTQKRTKRPSLFQLSRTRVRKKYFFLSSAYHYQRLA